MKQTNFYLVLLMIIFMAVVGCKKSTTSATNKTKAELLTQKSWKLVKSEENGMDFTPGIPACELDNIFIAKTNNTLTIDEGASKCDPGNPQETVINWSFQNNESSISIDGQIWQILTLDENTLKISISSSFQGTTYTTVDTYNH